MSLRMTNNQDDWMSRALKFEAEIERLQEAKRRALQVADERSAENVRLRAALKQIYDGTENQNIDHREFRIKARQAAAGALRALEQLPRCPHGDGNSCEQYRLQGQRCQKCPEVL